MEDRTAHRTSFPVENQTSSLYAATADIEITQRGNATSELPNNTSQRKLKKLKIQEAAAVADEDVGEKHGEAAEAADKADETDTAGI